MKIYFTDCDFKNENEVRQFIDDLTGQDIASLEGLSIDFIRQFRDRINFDTLLHAYYVSYHLDEKIKHQFKGYDLNA